MNKRKPSMIIIQFRVLCSQQANRPEQSDYNVTMLYYSVSFVVTRVTGVRQSLSLQKHRESLACPTPSNPVARPTRPNSKHPEPRSKGKGKKGRPRHGSFFVRSGPAFPRIRWSETTNMMLFGVEREALYCYSAGWEGG